MTGICVTSAATTAVIANTTSKVRSEDLNSIIALINKNKEDIETLLGEATVAGKRLNRLEAWNDFFAGQKGIKEMLVEWNELQRKRKERFDGKNVVGVTY